MLGFESVGGVGWTVQLTLTYLSSLNQALRTVHLGHPWMLFQAGTDSPVPHFEKGVYPCTSTTDIFLNPTTHKDCVSEGVLNPLQEYCKLGGHSLSAQL